MTSIIPIASQEKFDSISPNRSNGQAINLEMQFRGGNDNGGSAGGGGGGGSSSNSSSVVINDSEHVHSRLKQSSDSGTESMARSGADDDDDDLLPAELSKTAMCAAALLAVFVANVLSVVTIHDRTPATKQDANRSHPPLRDVTYDATSYDLVVRHQFPLVVVAEVTLLATSVYVLAVVVFHPHKSIVFRRLCFLLALLFALRLLTMNATMLPVSSVTLYQCAPKERGSPALGVIVSRFFDLLTAFGLSTVNGELRYCGNYVFSGHAVIVVLNCLMADEYGPTPRLLGWTMKAAAAFCMLALVAAGFDYTISIITAYYVTTRIFWIYHTMANNVSLKQYDHVNQVCKEWWYPIFRYLEGNVRNIVPPSSNNF